MPIYSSRISGKIWPDIWQDMAGLSGRISGIRQGKPDPAQPYLTFFIFQVRDIDRQLAEMERGLEQQQHRVELRGDEGRRQHPQEWKLLRYLILGLIPRIIWINFIDELD